jgi:hypothetical protein
VALYDGASPNTTDLMGAWHGARIQDSPQYQHSSGPDLFLEFKSAEQNDAETYEGFSLKLVLLSVVRCLLSAIGCLLCYLLSAICCLLALLFHTTDSFLMHANTPNTLWHGNTIGMLSSATRTSFPDPGSAAKSRMLTR